MSYTTRVKKELFGLRNVPADEKKAELLGILACKNAFSEERILLQVENLDVARRVWLTLRELTPLKIGIKYSVSRKLGTHKIFAVQVQRQKGYEAFLTELSDLRNLVKTEEAIRNAFIRGAFLACGYIKDPRREHALDFFIDSEALAWELFALLERIGKKSFLTKKRGKYLLYLRNSEDIKDLLILTGALEEYFSYENVTILKELKNKTVREMNYEVANETKALNTGKKQVEMIRYIREKSGLNNLSGALSDVAFVRLQNPERSLQEIADIIGISKSGVRNRFKRIEEIYQDLQNQNHHRGE
ncbi:MAG: DNA-binding protein WhiA [Fusobacteriaceae bacterium]|nr:DNA-binding protein WhiA [Fusobacteriaceae bacterium]